MFFAPQKKFDRKRIKVTVERDGKWFVVLADKNSEREVVSQGRTIASALRALAEALEVA